MMANHKAAISEQASDTNAVAGAIVTLAAAKLQMPDVTSRDVAAAWRTLTRWATPAKAPAKMSKPITESDNLTAHDIFEAYVEGMRGPSAPSDADVDAALATAKEYMRQREAAVFAKRASRAKRSKGGA